MRRGAVFRHMQSRFRGRRFALVEAMIRDLLQRQPEVSILDAGGRSDYWKLLPPDLRARTLIVVLNLASELGRYHVESPDLQISEQAGDACDMPQYAAGAFDIVHSNSVIEHVGSFRNMKRFADEVRRVGRGYYVQTPCLSFPIDPHYGMPFVHWLPDSTRLTLFQRYNVGYARKCSLDEAILQVDHTRIIARSTLRSLFPDGEIKVERLALLSKSNIAIRKA